MFDIKRFEKDIEELVNIESGSYDLEGVKEANKWISSRFEAVGYDITWIEHTAEPKSNSFIAHKGDIKDLEILFLCHSDTVFKKGDKDKNPFRKTDDGKRLMGLGVADMKSSCLYGLYLAEQLAEEKVVDCSKFAILYNGQEEAGSKGSKEAIEKYAALSKCVIVIEPARPGGECLKQRKGSARYTIKFTGKAAHSGVNPQDGESAILEMAHWIVKLESFNNYDIGLTLNCGVVEGGSSSNTVPASAQVEVDARAVDYNDALELDKKIKDMLNQKQNKNIEVEITGGIARPPMKPTEETEKFCAEITEEGKKFGLDIKWISSGGGSDGSFSAGLGVLTIDGVGPIGGKLHSFDEYLELKEIDTRFELLKSVTIKRLTK